MRKLLPLLLGLLLLAGCAGHEAAPAPPEGMRDGDGMERPYKAEAGEEYAMSIQPVPTLVIEANGRLFYADLEDNPAAEAFTEMLSEERLTVELRDYGGFEKVGPLPRELPRSDETITTAPGDVILYQGDQITIYYDENTWDFTRLARIGSTSREELLSVLGEGDVTVTFRIEWSE